MAFYNYQTVTIPSGSALSNAIDLQGHTIVGIQFPAAMTGTAIGLLESQSIAGTFRLVNLRGAITAYSMTISTTIALPPEDTMCINFLKIQSTSNEAADRVIGVISRLVA